MRTTCTQNRYLIKENTESWYANSLMFIFAVPAKIHYCNHTHYQLMTSPSIYSLPHCMTKQSVMVRLTGDFPLGTLLSIINPAWKMVMFPLKTVHPRLFLGLPLEPFKVSPHIKERERVPAIWSTTAKQRVESLLFTHPPQISRNHQKSEHHDWETES